MSRTKTVTLVTTPTGEEVELLHNTDQQESEMLFDGTKIGYLVHDSDCENPLDQDGNGAIYTRHRHADRETLRKFQEALGLDSDWQPDFELISETDLVAAIQADITASCENEIMSRDLWEKCVFHCTEYFGPVAGVMPLEHVLTCLDSENELTPVVDVPSYQKKLWDKGIGEGTIGNKYAVILDVYEHGQVAYRLSGEAPSCRWDTARGGAVWVPDVCAVLNFEDKNLSLEENRAKAREYSKSCVEEYTNWCNGDCWGVCIEKDGEELEMMWNIIGREYALKELKEAFDHAT